jgi:hypothetical protein
VHVVAANIEDEEGLGRLLSQPDHLVLRDFRFRAINVDEDKAWIAIGIIFNGGTMLRR